MNISLGARFVFLILLIGSTAACLNPFPPPQSQRPRDSGDEQRRVLREEARRIIEQEKHESEKEARKYLPRQFDVTTETGKVLKDAFDALNREDFEWLEREAAKARKNKERLAGGFWKIRNIYIGLENPPNNTDEEWEKHFKRLVRWKDKFPRSITARVALAESWSEYAWVARGSGYAHTVTNKGRNLFKERMSIAERELLEAKDFEERCPQWYLSMMSVALAQSRELEKFDRIYREAMKFEPHYYYFVRQKAWYLMPRWHGEDGDWEAFIEQAAEEIGGAEGAMTYYLVVSDFINNFDDIPFDGRRLSMDKAKQGFYELKKAYGADKQRLNEFAKFACRTNELPTAHEAFEEIGDNYLEDVWDSKERFYHYKSVAALAGRKSGQQQQPQHQQSQHQQQQPQSRRF
jgi:hypothetical protein